MVRFLVLALGAICLPASARAQPANGQLLTTHACVRHPTTYETYAATAREDYKSEAALAAKAGIPQPVGTDLSPTLLTRAEFDRLVKHPPACRHVLYGSDGLKVAAYIWEPAGLRRGAKLPAVIDLRGGNEDFGKFAADSLNSVPALIAAGFVVIGVQYRGVDGGEGKEQFGGSDVHDVVNAVALARNLPEIDARNVFLEGASRGGMMVYLAIRDGAKVNAAATISGLTDLELEAKRRPAMERNVWAKLIPNYDQDRSHALASRSGVLVAKKVDLPPMLILHGTADWRVDPRNSYEIAEALQERHRPYSLHIFDNDVHGLFWNRRERDRLIVDWFRKHMVG